MIGVASLVLAVARIWVLSSFLNIIQGATLTPFRLMGVLFILLLVSKITKMIISCSCAWAGRVRLKSQSRLAKRAWKYRAWMLLHGRTLILWVPLKMGRGCFSRRRRRLNPRP